MTEYTVYGRHENSNKVNIPAGLIFANGQRSYENGGRKNFTMFQGRGEKVLSRHNVNFVLRDQPVAIVENNKRRNFSCPAEHVKLN